MATDSQRRVWGPEPIALIERASAPDEDTELTNRVVNRIGEGGRVFEIPRDHRDEELGDLHLFVFSPTTITSVGRDPVLVITVSMVRVSDAPDHAVVVQARDVASDRKFSAGAVLESGGLVYFEYAAEVGALLEEAVSRLYADLLRPALSRPGTVIEATARQAVASLEPAIQSLVHVADTALAPDDELFVRNTIKQIDLWSQTDGDPRILELHISALVRHFLATMRDAITPIRTSVLEATDDESLADFVAGKAGESIDDLLQVGGEDPAVDGQVVQRLADRSDEIRDAVTPDDTGDAGLKEAAVAGATSAAAGELAKLGIRGVGELIRLIPDGWPQFVAGLVVFGGDALRLLMTVM